MNRGIYPPLAGAITLERRLDVVSHNISNLQTTGYKKDQPLFATILGQTSSPSVAGIDLFPVIDALPADRSQGVLTQTGEALDVALQGDGFFVAQTSEGERYFRGGKLHKGSNGNLLTHAGDPLLGASGPIRLPAGKISIDKSGAIRVNNAVIDRLRVEQTSEGQEPVKVGNLYWTVPENAVTASDTVVHQGMLEGSNVNPVEDMVELIKVTREFEQMQKVIQTMDELASQAIQAGRVQG